MNDDDVLQFWNNLFLVLAFGALALGVAPPSWRRGASRLLLSLPRRVAAALVAFADPGTVSRNGAWLLRCSEKLHGSRLGVLEFEQVSGYEEFLVLHTLSEEGSRALRETLKYVVRPSPAVRDESRMNNLADEGDN